MKPRLIANIANLTACLFTVLGLLVSPVQAVPTVIDWSSTAGTAAWATAGNWVGGVAPVSDLTTNTARFNQTSYAFQPTAPNNRFIAGLVIGDGVTSTATLTITTSTNANRLNIGDSGIVMNANSGTVTIGNAGTQGVTLGASQAWQNDSSSLLTVTSVANDADVTPFTLSLTGSGSGGITISNIIANGGTTGTTALIVNMSGSGAVNLNGVNTFTGGVTLTAGTLNLNNAKALGAVGGGSFIINGGTIDQTTSATLNSNVGITLGGNFAYGGTNNLNLGTGAITNAGNRTITLNGTAKTLTMGGIMTNSSGANQTTTVNGAGNTFSFGGYALSNSAADYINVINGTGNVTISGLISNGAGGSTVSGLTYSGSGVLSLTNANTFGGAMTINSGVVSADVAGVAATNGPLGIGATSVNAGGELRATSASALLGSSSISLTSSTSTLRGFNAATIVYGGSIIVSGNATVINERSSSGASTNQTYGTLSIGANTLNVQSTNSYTSGTAGVIFGTTTLTGNATFNVTNNGAATDTTNLTLGLTGETGGARNLTKSGNGLMTLAQANTYTGVTTINGGILDATIFANVNTASSIGAGSAGGSAGDLVFGGGTLKHSAANVATTDRLFTIGNSVGSAATLDSSATSTNGVAFTNAGSILFDNTFSGTHSLTLTGSNTTAAANTFAPLLGDGSGATSLNKTGAGTWTLSNAGNNYTGATTITGGGTLAVATLANGGSASAIGAASTAASNLVIDGGTLSITAATSTDRLFTLGAAGGTIADTTANNTVSFTNNGAMGFTGTGARTLTVLSSGSGGNNLFSIAAAIGDADGSSPTSIFLSGTAAAALSSTSNTFSGTITISNNANGFSGFGSLGSTSTTAALQLGGAGGGAGSLIYRGNGETSQRVFRLSATTSTNSIANEGSGALIFASADGQTILAGAKTFSLEGANADALNEFHPLLQDNTNPLSFTKKGAGSWFLSGTNTFTGSVTIQQGTLRVNTLADYNSNSSIGAATSGDIAFGGNASSGTLLYQGSTAASTNRTIAIGSSSDFGGSNATISNDGAGALAFTATTLNATQATPAAKPRTLTLGGSYAGSANRIAGIIQDTNGTSTIGVTKTGAGTWNLEGANSYTGPTIVSGGKLALTGTASLSDTGTVNVNTSGATFDISGLTTGTETIASLAAVTGTTVALGANNLTTNAASGSVTVAGDITGVGGSFTKGGAGTAIISSGASTFTGGVTLSAGVLDIGASSTPTSGTVTSGPLGTGTFVINGGTVSSTTGAFTLGNSITINGDFIMTGNTGATTSTFTGAVSLGTAGGTSRTITESAATAGTGQPVFSGAISNGTTANKLIKAGTGGLQLTSGDSIFTGGVDLTAGTLFVNASSVGSPGSLTSGPLGTGTLTISGGTTLSTPGVTARTIGNAVTVNGDFTLGVTGKAALTLSGAVDFGSAARTIALGNALGDVISGSISNGTDLILSSTSAANAVLTLGGTNSFSGNVTLQNTTALSVSSAANLGGASTISIGQNATLITTGTFSTSQHIDLGTGVNNSFKPDAGTVLTLSGIIDGVSTGPRLNGAGKLIISGASNSFASGSTFLAQGGATSVLALGNAAALNGTSLRFNGPQHLDNSSGSDMTLTGLAALKMTTGFTFEGTNSLDLSGAVAGFDTTVTTARTITVAANTLTIGGIQGTGSLVVGPTTTTWVDAALNKAGAGTLVIAGVSTFTGKTKVQNGKLSFNTGDATATNAQSLGQNVDVDLGVAATSSGTLNYTGGAGTLAKNINVLGNGSDTIQNSGSGLLTLSGAITKNGTTLTLKGGANGIDVTGAIGGAAADSDLIVDGGITTLSAANTYNGPTIIRNGATLNANVTSALPTATRSAVTMDDVGTGSTLALGASQSIASLIGASGTSSVTLAANTLTVGTTGGSASFAGVISGGGSLIKDDTSTQTLAGLNTYTGATTVSGGILEVASGSSTGGSSATGTSVGLAGTLVGNGTIAGTSATHTIDGAVNPGPALGGQGVLTFQGNLTFNGGSTALFEIGSSGFNDNITVGSLLTLNPTLSITVAGTLSGYSPASGNSWDLLDWGSFASNSFDVGTNFRTGGLGGGTLDLPTLSGGLVWDVSNFTTDGTIFVTSAVPEPGRALLLLIGMTGLLFRRRRSPLSI